MSGLERGQRPLQWWLWGALLALAVWRVATVALSGAGLHVDEAQYWLWSKSLDWGYYSKPPLVPVLIALSTAVAGDGVMGVKLGAMACWLLASGVLGRLAVWQGGPLAGWWTALLFASTLGSGLLGLAVTTDAPLALCWAGFMAALWRALLPGGNPAWWWAVGVCAGLGCLAKYSMGAALLSAACWWWMDRANPRWRGAWRAAVVALVLVLPNVIWNAQHGWVTWRHTADITVGATGPGLGSALALFVGGQLLLLGPAIWWVVARAGVLRWRKGPRPALQPLQPTARAYAHAFVWPIWILGLAQAVHAQAQMNWTAPVLLGLSLVLGLGLARQAVRPLAVVWPVVLGVGLSTAIALGGDLKRVWGSGGGSSWDLWARMRGWEAAFAPVRPWIQEHPEVVVAATRRDQLVQAAHAWRGNAVTVWSWDPPEQPRHHADWVQGLRLSPRPRSEWPANVLLITDQLPALAQGYAQRRLLHRAWAGNAWVEFWHLSAPITAKGGSS